jgi:hypothetical protein
MINTFMEPVLRRRYARVFLEIAGEGGLFAEQIGMLSASRLIPAAVNSFELC